MFKFIGAVVVATTLAGCGGGSGSSTGAAATPPVSTTPPGGTTGGTPPTNNVVSAPAVPANAVSMTAGSFTDGVNAQVVRVSFVAAANLTVTGQLNQLWISAAQPGGTVTVGGDMNTLVFMPGVDATLTVTGKGNTFYLPVGSSITAVGSGAASSTINYYKP